MAVPPDGKPVVKHATLDDGFVKVAEAIRTVMDTADAPCCIPRYFVADFSVYS